MLTPEILKAALPALGEVEVYSEIDSTNRRALTLAKEGAPDLTVVLADSQSRGRGRASRSFFSPPRTGIYLTLLTRPQCSPEEFPRLTLLAAVAAAEAIESVSDLRVGVKWVNDLRIGGRKVAGILTEGSFLPDGSPDYAVIGIGINVGEMCFPPELADIATSVANEAGTAPDRDALTYALLSRLLSRLSDFPGGDYLDAYRTRSVLTGSDVQVSRGDETFSARVTGIGSKGELLLRLPSGEPLSLSSGEIIHVTPTAAQREAK